MYNGLKSKHSINTKIFGGFTMKRVTKVNVSYSKVLQSKNITFKDLTDTFIDYKQSSNMSERTIKDYVKYFKEFEKFIPLEVNYDILKESIQKYLGSKTGKAPATYNVPYTVLNTLFNWAVDVEEVLPKNPIKALKLKKLKDKGRARDVEEDVINKLVSCIDIKTYAGFRNYTTIMVTLDTGIRPGELFQLRKSDFKKDIKAFIVPAEVAKNRESRILPLSPQSIELIEKLLHITPSKWDDYIFHTCEGNKMSVGLWEKQMSLYNKQANTNVRPYDLRHTFAIMFLRNGGNVFSLQRIMGHADLNMIKRYLNIATSDIKEQHTIASPINNFIRRTTRVRKLFK